MKTYEIVFSANISAMVEGSDADSALEELIADLESVPGVGLIEIRDVYDTYEVRKGGIDGL